MADAVDRWRANRAALAELALDPRELARRLELLEHEAAEIAAARLRPGEAEEIRRRLEAAQHGEAIARGAAALRDGARSATARGARDSTAVAVREARGLARLDPRFEPIAERLAGLEAELEDVAAAVRELAEAHRPRPGGPRARSRSGSGRSTRSSAGTATTRPPSSPMASAPPPRLERLAGSTTSGPAARREDARSWRGRARPAALSRRAARPPRPTSTSVGERARRARLPGRASFEVALGRRPRGRTSPRSSSMATRVAFDATGADQVVYRLAPNPGEPRATAGPDRLGRRAVPRRARDQAGPRRGRRDARRSSSTRSTPGIGGRSAEPIGRSLWALARRHQVLCVTHLPQIAAHADAHYRIAKRERDGRTVTEVERLDREGRIVELAPDARRRGRRRGEPRARARELLDRAEAWRGASARAG